MKNQLLAIICFAMLGQTVLAQGFDKARLDSFFNVLDTANRFMGSVAVSQHGKIIYSKTVGFADVENKLKATGQTKYRIGSISKTFTAVLVMKAVEEKKLSLDQTIDKFFPTIPNAGEITVSQLLYHRSGIHNFTNDPAYLSWYTTPKTEREMVEIIAKAGSDFEPGSKAAYSNSNYVLLSYILEKTLKQPYAALLKKYISTPLGLKDTYLGGKTNTKNKESKSYSHAGDWKLQPETDLSVPLGAGGIVSTPSDLVKFSDALFGGKLVSPASLERMKALKDKYGMGLFPIPFHDKTGFGHTGGIDGFQSVFCHLDDGSISYALTTNGTNYMVNNISIAILSAVYNKPYNMPDLKTFRVSPEDLDRYTGVYSSAQIPLQVTITRKDSTLFAQATGQPAFALEATGKTTFMFEMAGVVVEFYPEKNEMILKQGGGRYVFSRVDEAK